MIGEKEETMRRVINCELMVETGKKERVRNSGEIKMLKSKTQSNGRTVPVMLES